MTGPLAKQSDQSGQTSLRALHLLWIAPVICVAGFVLFVYAHISKCGISGCGGGGFGVSADPIGTIGAMAVAGLIAGALLAFVPWSLNRLIRATVAVVGAVLVCATIATLVLR